MTTISVSRPAAVIECMHGLGDNIYSRPFVRAVSKVRPVYLNTPWPELFEDLPNVFFLEPRTKRLRTQVKNVQRQTRMWSKRPRVVAYERRINYFIRTLTLHRTIFASVRSFFPEEDLRASGDDLRMDLPDFGIPPMPMTHDCKRPFAFVRPATVRREWANPARNPKPEYIAHVAEDLMRTHTVVMVADLLSSEEWLEGHAPPHHFSFAKGELDVRQMLSLLRWSDIAVGGVGFIAPASVALGNKAFVIFGGHGTCNSPEIVFDPQMDSSRIRFAKPEPFCQCRDMKHKCNKTIPNFPKVWSETKTSLALASSTIAARQA